MHSASDDYRFEYWKRLRAPFCPYFFRSFARASRLCARCARTASPRWRFDDATGALTHVQTAPVNSPSFVTVHPDGRHLYAVCERDGFAGTPDGAVASFAVDPHDGTLTEIGKVRSHGTSACHLSVAPGGHFDWCVQSAQKKTARNP